MELTLGAVLDATGAVPVWEPTGTDADALNTRPFHAVVIDSRRTQPGDLFVALPGRNTDGALFAGDAFAQGALAALSPRLPALTSEQNAQRRATCGADSPFVTLVVADPLEALQQTARYWRAMHDAAQVIAVTGSVGKTTTREAIASTSSALLPTLTAERSYNNEIGLPLTLVRLEHTHRAVVLEMGMYARGEIAHLAEIARPQIGVVTMVAPVHLERLGSIESIAAAKAELVQALPAAGVAILNGDDSRVRHMAALTSARAVYFGLGADNDWRATGLEDRGLDGLTFTLRRDYWSARVDVSVVGRHYVHALLAAAAVAEALGCELSTIESALPHARIAERQRMLEGPNGRLIIDDAWNASQPSMLAALDVLASVPRRHVAVLGEMLELGADAEAAHRVVGRRAAEVAEALVTVGEGGLTMADEARRAGLPSDAVIAVDSPVDVPGVLRDILRSGDAVLVKGSRGLRLERTVEWLLDNDPAVSGEAQD